MRATGRFRTCTLAGLLAMAPGLASAEEVSKPYPPCDRTPTEGDVTAAKGAFQAGNGSFNEADYDRAINYWEDAYRRDCTAHPLLLNLARAYELNGQKHHAVTALQTLLARNPGSSEEGQIKRRIEKLEEQLRAEGAAAAPPPAAAAPPVATTPVGEAPPAETPPPADAPSSGRRSIVPLIVAGAGGAIAIVSGIVWLGAKADVAAFEEKCPNRGCPLDSPTLEQDISDGNSAKKREDLSGGFAVGGLVVAAGGLVWYFVQKPQETAAAAPHGFTARVTPAFGPSYGGLSFGGKF